MTSNRNVCARNIHQKIEAVIENLVGVLELLRSGGGQLQKEMYILVLCKQKVAEICDCILSIFREVVIMKHAAPERFVRHEGAPAEGEDSETFFRRIFDKLSV